MILTEIQQYLSEQGRVSLVQMELHFRIDADALQGMLDRLVRKGRVRKLPIPQHCHGCTECSTECIQFYEWASSSPKIAVQKPDCCPN
ncbi:MAG: FeoC-like transcriptional regulator [Xenococcaceae cyanobacterium]